MPEWALAVSAVGAGLALLYLGVKLGSITARAESAHDRIDRLERVLADEFRELRIILKTSLEESWRHCPMAQSDGHNKEKT